MASFLILYSTTDGHTLKICKRLQEVIGRQGHHVEVTSIADGPPKDLELFDKIIIGASIRYGRHSRQVVDFIEAYQETLARKPNAFFSVNVVARKPGKNRPETNPYLQKFLREITWKPKQLAVFAGKIDYPRYGFFDRNIIRLIMWMTKGPTEPTAVVEFTDWQEVEDFGRLVGDL